MIYIPDSLFALPSEGLTRAELRAYIAKHSTDVPPKSASKATLLAAALDVAKMRRADARERVVALMFGAVDSPHGRIAPDVPPPENLGDYSTGWRYNAHDARVYKAWSGCTCHGRGEPPSEERWRRTASQNARYLYSTEALAYRAMAHELARRYADVLVKVLDAAEVSP